MCLIVFCVVLVSNQWFCMVFGRATDQTQSGCRLVPHGIRMKDRSQTGNQQYSLLAFWVFWMLPLGVLYESVTRPTAKESNKVLGLELLERDLERGKPLFRRKRGKVRNLDGSGHKGLADFSIFVRPGKNPKMIPKLLPVTVPSKKTGHVPKSKSARLGGP